MLVAQQLRCDQGFEEAAPLSRVLEVLEVYIEVERGVRVAAVLIRAEVVEQHFERIRKARVGALSLLELEAMDGGVDLGWIHAVLGQSFERVEHHALNFFRVIRVDAFQAGPKDRFFEVVLEATAVSQSAAELGVDEGFAERGAGVPKQYL